MFGAVRRGWVALASIGRAVSGVLATLDDRNPLAALRTLEGERAQDEGPRCARCVTRGE